MENLSSAWVKLLIFAGPCLFSIGATYGLLSNRLSNFEENLDKVVIVQEKHSEQIMEAMLERNTLNSDIRYIKGQLSKMINLLKDLHRNHHQHRGGLPLTAPEE